MITRIKGKLSEKKEQAVVIETNGLFYEVIVPASVLSRIENTQDEQGLVSLVIYDYMQITPSSGLPILVGFLNELEREFFLQFIKVSGIGPRAAVRALNQPIATITQAIDRGDQAFLKTLPGIGAQKAKEIIAKLQGKVGRFGLIQDEGALASATTNRTLGWQDEALSVLLQLQYRKPEAMEMIESALKRRESISSAEELLNEIYKQKVKS